MSDPRVDPATDGATTWREMIADATSALGDPREARFICEHAAGLDASAFHGAMNEVVTQRMGLHVQAMVRRRLTGEPLQYVLGRWGFRRLDLLVDRRVLIPRPETEFLVDVALEHARRLGPGRTLVDLGTGSGAVGLSLAFELPLADTLVWLTDASPDALDVARANLAGIGRAAANVRIAQGDWYAALPDSLRGGVDVVVSNPPYVAVDDPEVEATVHGHEPHEAIYAGVDGLDDLRVVIAGAAEWLRPDGVLVCEIGHRQADPVRTISRGAGFGDPRILRDPAGRDRVAVVRR